MCFNQQSFIGICKLLNQALAFTDTGLSTPYAPTSAVGAPVYTPGFLNSERKMYGWYPFLQRLYSRYQNLGDLWLQAEKIASAKEMRIDPEDQQILTFDQISAKYKGTYTPPEIAGYWTNWCQAVAFSYAEGELYNADFAPDEHIAGDFEVTPLGGKVKKMLIYDCVCLAIVTLNITALYISCQSWIDIDWSESLGARLGWLIWECSWSVLCMPFALFLIPGLGKLLFHIAFTGYDKDGACRIFQFPNVVDDRWNQKGLLER